MLFTCTFAIDGVNYLQIDPSVACWEGEHLTVVLYFGLVGIIVYIIGMPLSGYIVLRSLEDKNSPEARLKYGILYDGYRDEYWWWEILVVLRNFQSVRSSS